jgi:peptidoglycan hydrolase-like protein with peptidoglycan-binding domain
MGGPIGPNVQPAPARPADYWNDAALRLANGSIDGKYAAAKKKPANVPHNYVSDLQRDLIELGYLKAGSDDGSYGPGTERAVRRFQRHARRTLRMQGGAKVLSAAWSGVVSGVCDPGTAKEVRRWIDKKYRLPRGVHSLVRIDGGKLRDDVAKRWKEAIDDVAKKGGTLLPPGKGASEYYSDTWRNPASGFKSTGGNSKLSLHYTGRAVDLSMEPAGGKKQRWWIAKETAGSKTYWRIYCKTDKQDGTQGTKIAAKSKKYYEFYKNEGEKWIPEGYYVNLTEILKSFDFERIPAQDGWTTTAKKQEWWHFYYAKDVQETFLDEMELVGYSEDQLTKWGWTKADLDKSPG